MMTFIIKISILLTLTHAIHGSIDHETDSYLSSAAQSSFGGTPLGETISESHDLPLQSIHHVSGLPSTSFGTPINAHDLDLISPQSFHPIGINSASGADFGHGFSETAGLGGATSAELENVWTPESNHSPGLNLPQGITNPAASLRLQSVVQNIVRHIPIDAVRHVQVPFPQPVPVPGEKIPVPFPQPFAVPFDVIKHVPYPVYKTQHVEVERPVPVPVIKHIPFEVVKEVPVPVERPVEVIKHVNVPVEEHIEVPVPVWKPYPIHIIKHVTHHKKWW